MSVSYSEAGMTVSTFSWFCILLQLHRPHEASSRPPGRPSPCVRSRQAGTVVKEENEKVHLTSSKRLRSAESARISTPMVTRSCISYIYL